MATSTCAKVSGGMQQPRAEPVDTRDDELGQGFHDLRTLLGHPIPRLGIASQIERELVTQRGLFGATVPTQLSPPRGDLVEFA